MTLLQQLYAIVTGIFIMLFFGSVKIDDMIFHAETSAQLQRMMQSQSALRHAGAALSVADADALADALFASGVVREATVRDRFNTQLAHRTVRVSPPLFESLPVPSPTANPPAWFPPLRDSTPILSQPLHVDGRLVGTVVAVIDPRQITAITWQHGATRLEWFAAVWLLTLLLIHMTVMRSLRPLLQVVAQADALPQRAYPIQHALPATPQLRSVVMALNRLSTTLRAMVDTQTQAVNRLRDAAYRDRQTGLPNRRFLELHLQQLLASGDEFASGALVIVEVRALALPVERLGRRANASMLRQVVAMVEAATQQDAGPDYFIARWSDTGFAISVTPTSEREALAFGERLALGLRQDALPAADTHDNSGHIGIALYYRQSLGQWLAEADSALRSAQAKGPDAPHLHASSHPVAVEETPALTAARMADFLRAMVDQKNTILHLQPVLACSNRLNLLQYEVLLRAVGDDGNLLTATAFIPMAKRLGLMPQIDRLVVTEVLVRLRQKRYGAIRLAVNLSIVSLRDPDFCAWLYASLHDDPDAASRIAFEVSEIGILDQIDTLRTVVDQLRRLGAQFGIDRVGRGFAPFDYLSSLTLDYLKIDGSLVRGIQLERDNQLLLDSICKVAHGLDVLVIAESVESDEEWHCLGELPIDGVQGYGVGMPAEI